jgi:hypothetical protein
VVWEPGWLADLGYRDLLEMSRFHFAVVRSVGEWVMEHFTLLYTGQANRHFYSIANLTNKKTRRHSVNSGARQGDSMDCRLESSDTWGSLDVEGKNRRRLHENNTQKGLEFLVRDYNYYSVWCHNAHKLLDMATDLGQIYDLLLPDNSIRTAVKFSASSNN